MKTLSLHGAPRQLLAKLHRWSGLALLVFVVIAGATGTWLAFRHELDRLINPELRIVSVGASKVSLESVYARVAEAYPNTYVTTVVMPERPDESLTVYISSSNRTPLAFNQIYIDPYTGAILGARSTVRLALGKEYLDPLILRLHYSLLLDQPGSTIMGITALVWLLTNIIGLALSWPSLWYRLASWIPILSVRTTGSYKVNYDLHRMLGVVFLPALIVLAFTSVYLNLPQLIRPAVQAVSTLPDRPVRPRLALTAPTVSPDIALATAQAAVPDGRVTSMYRDFSSSWYSVLMNRPGDLPDSGEHFVYVDLTTGAIAATKSPQGASAGEHFLRWQFPLHTGQAFGLVGRILVALTGLCILVLSVTGFYVWWTKWLARRRARARSRSRFDMVMPALRPIARAFLGLGIVAAVFLASRSSAQTQAPYPRSFTDGKNHTVTLKAKPTRIASVVLGMDENLLDLVEPSRLVALTELSKDPFVSNIAGRVPPRVGFVRDKWQVASDAKPDLVLAATYTPTLADPLIAAKLPVYQFSEFSSIDALLKNFEKLGELVGEPDKARTVLQRDRAILADAAKRPWPKRLRAVYYSEGLIFTKGTVPSELVTAAGLIDAASLSGNGKGIVKATPDLLAKLNPDVIVFGEDSQKAEAETLALFKTAAYQAIPAAKGGKVYAIPGKHITTTSHNIVKAVEDIQRLVKP